jgi:two-component system, NtrC family, sensor histidine kinase KinB
MAIRATDRSELQTLHERANAPHGENARVLASSGGEHLYADGSDSGTAQFVALLEGLSDGVVIADANGRLVMLNAAARYIAGIDPAVALRTTDQLNALDIRDVHDEPLAGHRRPLSRALQGESFADVEVLVVRADGRRRRVVTTGTSALVDGHVAAAMVVLRDVTETRDLEQQREKDLALMSHDLSGPANAVRLLAGSLRLMGPDDGLSERALDRIARIERNADRMLTMVTALREATGLGLRAATLRCVPCSLARLLADTIDCLDDAARARVAFDPGTGICTVLADPLSIERAFGNLLASALEQSDALVRMRVERSGAHVIVEVIDPGVGIFGATRATSFEPCVRDPAGQTCTQGLGLGLYITRLVAEAHGGYVAVHDDSRVGSTFRFVLPLLLVPS